MSDVAKRLVACKHFHWKGMRAVGRKGSPDAWFRADHLAVRKLHGDWKDALPDLSDPGTLGCLLALVAEAYGVTLNDVRVVRTTGRVWSVWIFRPDDSSYRVATHKPSRAEALVAALEAKE